MGHRRLTIDELHLALALLLPKIQDRLRSQVVLKWSTSRVTMRQRETLSKCSKIGSLRTQAAVKSGLGTLLYSFNQTRTRFLSLHNRLSKIWSIAWHRRHNNPWETLIYRLRALSMLQIAPLIMIVQNDNLSSSQSPTAPPLCSRQPIAKTDSVQW